MSVKKWLESGYDDICSYYDWKKMRKRKTRFSRFMDWLTGRNRRKG